MLTEPVDYDLDTHPITAGAGVMEIRAGLFGMQLQVKHPGFYAVQSLQKSAAEQSKCGLRPSTSPSAFELFSLVSGGIRDREAIPEGAHSAKIYLVRRTLDLDI
jgi:hypothetical protein